MAIELSGMRETSAADLPNVADYAGVPLEDLQEWERTGRVPRKHAARVKWARWSAASDAALARSGMPECESLRNLGSDGGDADVDALLAHIGSCDLCVARSRYVDEHVGPMPALTGGIMARAIALGGRFSGWKRSALAGSMILLLMAGIGVLMLLGIGLVRRDLTYVAGAGGLFVALVVSGAAGGVVYHLTAAMRDHGVFGYYSSAILTVYGYLLAIAAMFGVAVLVVGSSAVDPEMAELLTTPMGWWILAAIGALFGVVFGRAMRQGK